MKGLYPMGKLFLSLIGVCLFSSPSFATSSKIGHVEESFVQLEEAISLSQEREKMEGMISTHAKASGHSFGRYLNEYFQNALETKSFDRAELEKVIHAYVYKSSALPIVNQQEQLQAIQAELKRKNIPDLGAKNKNEESDLVSGYYINGMYKITTGAILTALALLGTDSPEAVTAVEGMGIGLAVFLPKSLKDWLAFIRLAPATSD